ncbi:MAG TPA: zinc-dependent metalloprotease [Actinomycetota bacterium]|nr:zinc-dependent metalloprotease [Actinomycetota bacterium]
MQLIDPRVARTVARRFVGPDDMSGSYLMERLRADLAESVPLAEDLVSEVSGIPRPEPVRWGVIDRVAWTDANISGMSRLLDPLTDRLGARLERFPLPVRIAQRAAISAEVGVLLGYISRRVLGQYDVLVTESSDDPAPALRRRRSSLPEGTTLYFVGQNIVETERRLGFIPRDFALWVAVHEVTHRFQFAGVPWLRERFFSLISSYLGSLELDARGLASRISGAAKRVISGKLPPEERNPIYLLATEDQRRALDELQALMAVVEGHGNYVMDAAGRDVIPSFPRMRRAFERRREQTTFVQRVVNHAIGLEMKLRQYELGQQFCEAVVAREGREALQHLWSGPETFPVLEELREPDRWLKRVA